MGRPKQTLEFEGTSLLRRAAQAALGAGCSPVIVVTGANAEVSRRELSGLDVREVLNPDWQTGMASSIAAGLDGLLNIDRNAVAVVIMVCDQPYVTADVVSRLVSAHRLNPDSVIASKYDESFGVPALFTRPLFDELARLRGPAGAKEVIRKHAAGATFLPFPEGEVDVDTPEVLARVLSPTV